MSFGSLRDLQLNWECVTLGPIVVHCAIKTNPELQVKLVPGESLKNFHLNTYRRVLTSSQGETNAMSQSVLHSGKFLTPDEDQRLLNRLTTDPHRDALMLLILRNSGLRGCELRSLRLRELNRQNGTIFVRAAKGSKDRELPLPKYVFERLICHVEMTPLDINGRIFPICRSRLSEIWRGYRPIGCGKGVHSLRHTFAIELYREKKDIILVKEFLGHKSILSTMIYQEYAIQDEQFKRYMDDVSEKRNWALAKA